MGFVNAVLAHFLWCNDFFGQLISKSLYDIKVFSLWKEITATFVLREGQEIQKLILWQIVIVKVNLFAHVEVILAFYCFFGIVEKSLELG